MMAVCIIPLSRHVAISSQATPHYAQTFMQIVKAQAYSVQII